MTYNKKTYSYTRPVETRRHRYAISYHYYGVFRSPANISLATLPALIPCAAAAPDILSLRLRHASSHVADLAGYILLRGYKLSPIIYRKRHPHILNI